MASGSPNKEVLAPEMEHPFKITPQVPLNPAWRGLKSEKRLHLLFEQSYRDVPAPSTHSKHLSTVPPKDPKRELSYVIAE